MSNAHRVLDDLKRSLAIEVVRRFGPDQIRAKILENLGRWQSQGSLVYGFDEWKRIAESCDDGELLAAMVGWNERADCLRQSAPYVGLLPKEVVRQLNELAISPDQ